MAVLEDAIAAGNDFQKDKSQGQLSFFDAFESDEEIKQDARTLPDVEPWPQPLLLQNEKDVLGMYVTSHPLAEHATKIHYYSTAHTNTLRELGPDTEVIIGGIITRVRTVITKQGRGAGSRMAFITMEDLNGTVDAVVFPDTLAQFEHMVGVDKMVFIKGEIDFRREDPSIRVNGLYDMNCAEEELTHAVFVQFDDQKDAHKKLEEFKTLCHRHRGKCPVYVEVPTAEQMSVVIQTETAVRPDPDFCRQLTALAGSDQFRLLRMKDRLSTHAAVATV